VACTSTDDPRWCELSSTTRTTRVTGLGGASGHHLFLTPGTKDSRTLWSYSGMSQRRSAQGGLIWCMRPSLGRGRPRGAPRTTNGELSNGRRELLPQGRAKAGASSSWAGAGTVLRQHRAIGFRMKRISIVGAFPTRVSGQARSLGTYNGMFFPAPMAQIQTGMLTLNLAAPGAYFGGWPVGSELSNAGVDLSFGTLSSWAAGLDGRTMQNELSRGRHRWLSWRLTPLDTFLRWECFFRVAEIPRHEHSRLDGGAPRISLPVRDHERARSRATATDTATMVVEFPRQDDMSGRLGDGRHQADHGQYPGEPRGPSSLRPIWARRS